MQDHDVFLKRVKRAYYGHVRPDIGYDEDGDHQAFHESQLICKRHFDKLPFSNVDDAGKILFYPPDHH